MHRSFRARHFSPGGTVCLDYVGTFEYLYCFVLCRVIDALSYSVFDPIWLCILADPPSISASLSRCARWSRVYLPWYTRSQEKRSTGPFPLSCSPIATAMPLRAIDLQRCAILASLEVQPIPPCMGVSSSYPATYPVSPPWSKIPNPCEKCGLSVD